MNPLKDKDLAATKLVFDVTEDILVFMEDNNISKSDLAKKLNVNKSYISQLLSGDRNMTLTTLSNICTALEIPVKIKIANIDREYKDIDEDFIETIPCDFLLSIKNVTNNIRKISDHPVWKAA